MTARSTSTGASGSGVTVAVVVVGVCIARTRLGRKWRVSRRCPLLSVAHRLQTDTQPVASDGPCHGTYLVSIWTLSRVGVHNELSNSARNTVLPEASIVDPTNAIGWAYSSVIAPQIGERPSSRGAYGI